MRGGGLGVFEYAYTVFEFEKCKSSFDAFIK